MNDEVTSSFWNRHRLKLFAAVLVYLAGWGSAARWHATLVRVTSAVRTAFADPAAPADPVPHPTATYANASATATLSNPQSAAVSRVAMSPVKTSSMSAASGNVVPPPSVPTTIAPVIWDDQIDLLNMTFVRIPAGSATLGPRPEEHRHSTITDGDVQRFVLNQDDYWIMKTEFTQEVYERLTGNNPSVVVASDLPVTNVTIAQVLELIEKLQGLFPDCRFQLPTCEQSEFAARVGAAVDCPFAIPAAEAPSYRNAVEKFENGDIEYLNRFISQYARFNATGACPVATCQPNGIGIHDLCGNVWEWCRPDHQPANEYWPIRGGACSSTTVWGVTSAVKDHEHRDVARESIGFRLMVEPKG